MPQPHVLDSVLRAARRLPRYPNLHVLDLSAGRGEIAAALARDGCSVRGTHFRDDDYKTADRSTPMPADEIAIDRDVDLTRPLPHPDAAFDLVILSEVAEHLPTYIPVIAEIGRVLAPGGSLVLSTPNVARLHSRWHYFWTGTHKLIRRRVGWDLAASDLYAYHVSPVDFPLLHTLLHLAGLETTRLDFTRFKWRHAWLLAAYPVVWIATRIETLRRVKGPEWARGESDLFRWMVSPAMLASEQLLVTARKEAVGNGSPRQPAG
jgi:SAM-dependent methyltransferase